MTTDIEIMKNGPCKDIRLADQQFMQHLSERNRELETKLEIAKECMVWSRDYMGLLPYSDVPGLTKDIKDKIEEALEKIDA